MCSRISTICSTCRFFRRSIVGKLGYCGLDSRRALLRGDELRPCWEPVPADPVVLFPAEPEIAAPRNA